jgi:hypothetical protein
LEFRLKKRGIPYDIPKRIYRDSNERYYDNIAGHKIAVSRLDYSGREREVMIAYDEFEGWIDPIQSGGVRSSSLTEFKKWCNRFSIPQMSPGTTLKK